MNAQHAPFTKNFDAEKHARGESVFVDDVPVPEGTLYAHVWYSPAAHGTIRSLDTAAARAFAGVKAVLTAADIPGTNEIGGIIRDEPLLADGVVHFRGQPVALVVAETARTARAAAASIRAEIDPLPSITDAREAAAAGELIMPPIRFELGHVEKEWDACDLIVEGRAETGAQEHLYLETQCAIAIPTEGGGIRLISSTQSPTAVQRAAAGVVNLPMHRVEVDVVRLGGGFGGKEDQATAWAALAALGAVRCRRPVKLVLHRQDDMRMTGKRHPYSSDYKLGVKRDGTIIAYDVTFFQNAGAAADLSPAVLQRTLFHCTNSYYIPNVRAVGYSCRTNLPPNTAFRGFGGPQGKFVIETAIAHAARALGMESWEVQKKNLLKEGDEFPYGQTTERCHAAACWNALDAASPIAEARDRVRAYNAEHEWMKKGVAVMPICFGISFTNTMLNQASALVHIYTDGSVGVSTAAVEMGQGVNMKILSIVSRVLSIAPERVKMETTNTTRAANTSATAASSGADLNGGAAQAACGVLVHRLKRVAARQIGHDDPDRIDLCDESVFSDGVKTEWTWTALVAAAYASRVSLSSQHFYATPDISFDKVTSKGRPFAYHVYGTALIEATVDCLRGTAAIDSVDVVHDLGRSLHPAIDRSQAEGAIMQGIGWMTMEEILYDREGRLMTDALSTYKVPDMHFAPEHVAIRFLEHSENPWAPFNSKAIGEPPFMYGIGAFFALADAVRAFRPDAALAATAPMTHERLLGLLFQEAYAHG